MKIGSLEGVLNLTLWATLVVATVYVCKPASEPWMPPHNPETCGICTHPNSRIVGQGDQSHDIAVGAEWHLNICPSCRSAGLTAAEMLAGNTPTPCMSTDGDSRP
jgi:hypothetical protein